MRIMALAAAVGGCAIVMAGCSTVPEGDATFVRSIDIDYAKFAACAYREMDKVWPNLIRLVDLRGENTINLNLEVTTNGPLGVLTVRQIEVVLKKTGERRTRVEIRARVLSSPDQAWSKIETCAESTS